MKTYNVGNYMSETFKTFLECVRTGSHENCQDFLHDYTNHIVEKRNLDYEEARKIAESNIGYMSGYVSRESRKKIEEVSGIVHPLFGSCEMDITADEIRECKRLNITIQELRNNK